MSRRSEAVSRLSREELSCVIEKDGRTYTSDQFGIKPLMQFLRRDRRFFEGAAVADKVIGKAAALLLIDGGAAEVFGAVMSESAAKVLSEHGVSFGYCELVPMIENRTHTGMCPMEETVLHLADPSEAFSALEKTIARLMQEKAQVAQKN